MIYPINTPLLEAMVLAVISREDAYGYQISQEIKTVSNLKESALYPVLKRLQEKGYLCTYDMQYQGRNRKYYRITELGKKQHRLMEEEWENYKISIDRIMRAGGEGK